MAALDTVTMDLKDGLKFMRLQAGYTTEELHAEEGFVTFSTDGAPLFFHFYFASCLTLISF